MKRGGTSSPKPGWKWKQKMKSRLRREGKKRDVKETPHETKETKEENTEIPMEIKKEERDAKLEKDKVVTKED